MKKILMTTAALTAASVASAQQFVAAWDFADVSVGGGAGSLDTNENFIANETADFVQADYAGSGLFEWSGLTNDSSGFLGGSLSSNRTDDVVGGVTVLGEGLQFTVAANPDAEGSFTLSGLDFTGLQDANLSFAAAVDNFDTAVTLNLSGIGTQSLAASDTEYNVDISALDGLSNQSITFSFSDFAGTENVRFDNFQVTAVPEPSAFAATFGVIALGFAAVRRRRLK